MKIRIIAESDLEEEAWSIWRRIQSSEPTLASPYFCPQFTTAVASVRSDVRVAVLWEDEEIVGFFPFQRNRLHMGRPVGGRLSDYHGVICRRNVQYGPEELLDACGLVSFDFDHLINSPQQLFSLRNMRTIESPIIDLSGGYDAYVQQARRRGSRQVLQLERKMRKFQREVGPLRFEPQVTETAVLHQLMAWKSAQYRRSRTADVFGRRWTVQLLERIHATDESGFSGMLSALYCGETMVASHFGMRFGAVLHWWFPTYDEHFREYSPGLLLLLKLMQEAEALGIRVIDLGRGDERYKSSLMNGSTPIAEGRIERPSLVSRMRKARRATEGWAAGRRLPRLARLPGRLLRRYERWQRFR